MDTAQSLAAFTHSEMLGILARVDVDRLKAFAEPLIDALGDITVVENRTGLVMLPMRDTAQGTNFHLGEVLVSEAHIRVGAQQGYGMRRGRDLETVMAMALVDLTVSIGVAHTECAAFLAKESALQHQEDHDRLCQVEATRVDMETF
ncbi:phosphonate C-P lyase system protein PhnG [Loktanella sp. D2R18]|uniref:phosphonate C-P lyase system protein PhnG n=1 Tax=Rhodobacterales TaxID=204455 RepID=UPI000DE8E327|nr:MULTISPECIES: phosphonate C-P lyase system protein PhnG [Rhodobacterales]MDO6589945.1 phosphonate C-P lyase system protein PhnG [Yoonia sp. 1_MG-2023]RBW45910.1 phosphonate C-P lyase system protein PhnG [Loktanella sp. D2R18]